VPGHGLHAPERRYRPEIGIEGEVQSRRPSGVQAARCPDLQSGPAPRGLGQHRDRILEGAGRRQRARADPVQFSRKTELGSGEAKSPSGALGPPRIALDLGVHIERAAEAEGSGRQGIQ
jgi:hypothetical protein